MSRLMSRLGPRAALTCAVMLIAAPFAPATLTSAALAAEDCSQYYRICNRRCDQPASALDLVLLCKGQCNRQLIACDGRPINASGNSSRFSQQGGPKNTGTALPYERN